MAEVKLLGTDTDKNRKALETRGQVGPTKRWEFGHSAEDSARPPCQPLTPVRRRTTFVGPYIVEAIVANRDRPNNKMTQTYMTLQPTTPEPSNALTLQPSKASTLQRPPALPPPLPLFSAF